MASHVDVCWTDYFDPDILYVSFPYGIFSSLPMFLYIVYCVIDHPTISFKMIQG